MQCIYEKEHHAPDNNDTVYRFIHKIKLGASMDNSHPLLENLREFHGWS
jgi:hypothetical protein